MKLVCGGHGDRGAVVDFPGYQAGASLKPAYTVSTRFNVGDFPGYQAGASLKHSRPWP